MCKETTKEMHYLYMDETYVFYASPEKKSNYIISSTNFKYMLCLIAELNIQESILENYGKYITNDEILTIVINTALLQDKECNIVFNKDNQI